MMEVLWGPAKNQTLRDHVFKIFKSKEVTKETKEKEMKELQENSRTSQNFSELQLCQPVQRCETWRLTSEISKTTLLSCIQFSEQGLGALATAIGCCMTISTWPKQPSLHSNCIEVDHKMICQVYQRPCLLHFEETRPCKRSPFESGSNLPYKYQVAMNELEKLPRTPEDRN